MVQKENLIVLAVVAVFASLAGLLLAIHGIVSDNDSAFRWDAGVVAAAVTGLVTLLNLTSEGER